MTARKLELMQCAALKCIMGILVYVSRIKRKGLIYISGLAYQTSFSKLVRYLMSYKYTGCSIIFCTLLFFHMTCSDSLVGLFHSA